MGAAIVSADQDLDYAIEQALRALAGVPAKMGEVPPRVGKAAMRVSMLRLRMGKLSWEQRGGKQSSIPELSSVRHQLEALAVVGLLALGDDRTLEGRKTAARKVKGSREIVCPKCHADIGQSCKSIAGHWLKVDHWQRRFQAANEKAEQ